MHPDCADKTDDIHPGNRTYRLGHSSSVVQAKNALAACIARDIAAAHQQRFFPMLKAGRSLPKLKLCIKHKCNA